MNFLSLVISGHHKIIELRPEKSSFFQVAVIAITQNSENWAHICFHTHLVSNLICSRGWFLSQLT